MLGVRVLSYFLAFASICHSHSTAGIEALVKRRLPEHASAFKFSLINASPASGTNSSQPPNDHFTVCNGASSGKIDISGNSPIALASGLRWYVTNYAHVDIYWFIGSKLKLAPHHLPPVNATYRGSSIVPWRYHFNTVTFSYTAAFWSWEDWELQLDCMALRGVNLPLAWVGYEKILTEVLLEAGFSQSGISAYLSGPAFQSWNRFGNIQRSWGGELPMSWIEDQFGLQKKIVARMVELGMTPVLPCFTGFVPPEISTVYPNASFVNGSQWGGFPAEYTNVTFLEPFDPLYAQLQHSFISKQAAAYGNVSHVYTLDQYNENNPYSGDLTYLRNVSQNTIATLKAVDPDATWMIQGWLFYEAEAFWTSDRIEAYLGGVNNSDMLILDLFSESEPQWQRTNSYYGKPWIWCQLHDFGANMGLYGQLENVTYNPIEALGNSTTTMVGMGLTPEGQEGNEIMYDILLDQAWSATPIDTKRYFNDWVTSRYHNGRALPSGLYEAWSILRQTVYNNTDLAGATAVTKSIFELTPNITGLVGQPGSHPTTIQYDPAALVKAWHEFHAASKQTPALWDDSAYRFDLTDMTRQVLANAFYPLYDTFVNASNSSSTIYSPSTARTTGEQMARLLRALDDVLSASREPHFSLPAWISSARAWASSSSSSNSSNSTVTAETSAANTSASSIADFYEYEARNQVTLWGPDGEISDYASKQWGGLIGTYYVPRWRRFVEFTLNSTTAPNGANEGLSASLLEFEERWQKQVWGQVAGESYDEPKKDALRRTIARVVKEWPSVFHM